MFKKYFVLLIGFLVLSSSLNSKAATITSSTLDTYTIKLTGNDLNNVSGLNITVKLPRKQADITTGVTFSGMGATTLLSTVTGPTGEDYLISLVLNGMITDGKATITGMLVDGSIINGAEFLVTGITRDGGTDLTSLLTVDISFSNSKATPTPSPSATPVATSTPASTPVVTATPVSEAVQNIIDIIDPNGETEISAEDIQTALDNSSIKEFALTASKTVQLKKNGLNKIYVRMNGLFKKDFPAKYLHCYLFSDNIGGEQPTNNFITSPAPAYFANLSSVSGAKYRFTKRVGLSVLPNPGTDGEKIIKGEIDSISLDITAYCYATDKNLDQYAKSIGVKVPDLTFTNISNYAFPYNVLPTANVALFGNQVDVKILAPKAADTSGN